MLLAIIRLMLLHLFPLVQNPLSMLADLHLPYVVPLITSGIIERSAIDGQKVYHGDLEKAMRTYIQGHQSEFLPEGVEVTSVALEEAPAIFEAAAEAAADDEKHPTPEALKQRERERNARGLQWAWDTFDGAYQVAKRSTKGALELVHDAWDQSTSTTILWFVIVILVFSNLWTLTRVGSGREEASRKLESRKVEEREKWVQTIVTALWDELSSGNKEAGSLASHLLPPTAHPSLAHVPSSVLDSVAPAASQTPVAPPSEMPSPQSMPWKEEVQQLHQTLNAVEQRIKAIRESLAGLEPLNTLD